MWIKIIGYNHSEMNILTSTTSPYLLQHAANPVDWFSWGDEALQKARDEDKPIFLSIGYAACHWCHVMAHESFENVETAAYLNEHFISIKVDREERPDIDSIYMQAVVSLTGQGGWPLSVFLMPNLRPFYGGTYFPPVRRYNMPSFMEVLRAVQDAWQNRRGEVMNAGQQITIHLQNQGMNITTSESFTQDDLLIAGNILIQGYDWMHGGWGAAPKFPQPMAIEFLLRRHLDGDKDALKPAIHTLHAMARGGMYDGIGGGFHRYSTDANWLIPHFEKMLYDNAQLALAYLHAWQLTGNPSFRRVVEETLGFIRREMTHPEGGFYSSLDADSEGEEGKFYVWGLDEIRERLGKDSEFFEMAYGITPRGNWEGKTILQRTLDDSILVSRFGLTREQVTEKLNECHRRLLQERTGRVRPGTDDKVLTTWNALALSAFSQTAVAFDRSDYLEIAARNADFLLTSLRPEGQLRRSWRDGHTTREVFLEDYAALIIGLLDLYQADFNNRWYMVASELAEGMIEKFQDASGGFFDTPKDAEALLTRPKDLQDNATPSGNALAAEALLKLGAFSENNEWQELAWKALAQVKEMAVRYPTAFARHLSAAHFALGPVKQVAVVGDPQEVTFQGMLKVLWNRYQPNRVLAASHFPPGKDAPALLQERPLKDRKTTAYVCEKFACKKPTNSIEELEKQLD